MCWKQDIVVYGQASFEACKVLILQNSQWRDSKHITEEAASAAIISYNRALKGVTECMIKDSFNVTSVKHKTAIEYAAIAVNETCKGKLCACMYIDVLKIVCVRVSPEQMFSFT